MIFVFNRGHKNSKEACIAFCRTLYIISNKRAENKPAHHKVSRQKKRGRTNYPPRVTVYRTRIILTRFKLLYPLNCVFWDELARWRSGNACPHCNEKDRQAPKDEPCFLKNSGHPLFLQGEMSECICERERRPSKAAFSQLSLQEAFKGGAVLLPFGIMGAPYELNAP